MNQLPHQNRSKGILPRRAFSAQQALPHRGVENVGLDTLLFCPEKKVPKTKMAIPVS
jgi:hypothetical protein